MINRNIIQTVRTLDNIPEAILDNIKDIRVNNPEWTYRIYDNKDVFIYIKKNFPDTVFKAFSKIDPNYGAVIADFFRYLVIYREGGCYLDIKSSLKSPLSQIILPKDEYLLSQWNNKNLNSKYFNWGFHESLKDIPGGEYQQWFLISRANHPFLKAVILKVLNNIENYDPKINGVGFRGVMNLAGPVCYTLALAPILSKSKFRFINSELVGLIYSVYQSHYDRPKNFFFGHYSQKTFPIIIGT